MTNMMTTRTTRRLLTAARMATEDTMTRAMRQGIVIGLAVAALSALGSLTACSNKCATGATATCACMGGVTGTQTCAADGTFGTCDCGQLSEARARELVLTQDDFTDGVQCEVQVRPIAHERNALATHDETTRACAEALEVGGFVQRGRCTSEFCSEREFTTTSKSQVRSIWLTFRCGSVRLLNIASISTTGSQATFSYEREVIPDQAVMQQVSSCQLRVAEPGRAVRVRNARRDDAGNWALVAQ